MNNPFEQSYLAGFAPKKSLDNYAKGADPRVINDIIALSELKEQAAMRQRADLASGAAQGQMPTVRDKIIQMFQQANQPRQQPQQQPNPMAQGIMAQARPPMQPQVPQEAPPEAQMYHGGVARLPVSDRMFGYAGGGIIAFSGKERSDVPRIGEEIPLTPEERARLERELEMRLVGERSRAGIPDEVPANLKNPRMDVTDLDFLSVPGMEKSDVLQRAMDSIQQKREPQSPTPTPRPAKTLARPIGQETPLSPEDRARLERELEMRLIGERARAGISGAINRPTVDDAASRIPGQSVRAPSAGPVERDDAASRIPGQSVRAPANKERVESSELGRNIANTLAALPGAGAVKGFFGGARGLLGGLGSLANREDNQSPVSDSAAPTTAPTRAPTRNAKQADLEKLHQLAIAGGNSSMSPNRVGIAQNIKTAPGATPGKNVTKPSVTTSTDTPPQNEISELMTELKKQYGPQPAVESTEDRLKKRDEYVKNAPTSEEALALMKHFDRMAKRYEANDQAEEAQKAINARNNLWTFLTNTRGSSLGVAAGKANAALQPLLADQETRRQNYQKLRDEQEMLLGKAQYEIRSAERARKEGRYADAEKAELEAKKLQEQARGHNIQGLGSLINAAGSREERRLTREQNDRHFGIQMEEMRLRREQMREDSQRIKDQNDRTNRENAYGRQSAETRKAIEKAQKMLEMPGLPDEIKAQAQATLTRLQKQDNDMYERIVVRGDTDYRPSPMVKGGNSALTSKADKIVGIGAK